jgi:transposase-like protein
MKSDVKIDPNEERTLEKYLELYKPKNRRSDDQKRAILAQVDSKPGMTVAAVAWINKVPATYLYRWIKQLNSAQVQS